MRVFIAIPIPVHLKAKLTALQQEFRLLPLEASWVREAGFHLTLKFLGDVDSTRLPAIISSMTATLQCAQQFSIELTGVGVFPSEANPRVLWVGVQHATRDLQYLQQGLDAQLLQAGFPSEQRPFTPHLTLARFKRVLRRSDLLALLGRHCATRLGQLDVDRLELVESQLHASGARYSTIHTAYFVRATATTTDDCRSGGSVQQNALQGGTNSGRIERRQGQGD